MSRLKLAQFSERFLTPLYTSWLNDREVNKFLYVGRIPVAHEEQRLPQEPTTMKFAVLSNLDAEAQPTETHQYYIGTATLSNLDWICRRVDLGYMIGDRRYWGLGLGTELVELMSSLCFDDLGLNKIAATVVDGNTASVRVLEKNGFEEYGVEKDEFWFQGGYRNIKRFHKFRGIR
jgi:RimJ/RimL family protein N-acetyltransferase